MLRSGSGRLLQRKRRARQFGARDVIVAVLGSLALFVICCLAAGYLNAQARGSWGLVEQVGTGRRVPFDSRVPPGARYIFVSVTHAGSATGLRPADVIDMTGWTLSERLAFAYPSAADPVRLTVQRDQQTIALIEPPDARITNGGYSRISDIALRLLLLCSGLVIIKYGHGVAALAAGIYLASVSMADSPSMTFAGLPAWVQTAALLLAAVLSRLAVYAARFTFAIQLLRPLSRSAAFALWGVFGVLSLVLFTLVASNVGGLLFGATLLAMPAFALPAAYICIQTYSVALFAAAAVRASKRQRFAIRIVFFATLFTASSYVIQEVFIIAGKAPPPWMFWYFNSALLFAGIGYPWAIFARQIAGVDFIISRGVGYAISIGLIVVAVNLLETVAEQVASGWFAGIMLDYGIPVALGLSLNWVQGRVTALLENILDHDLLNTSRVLEQLKSEMADDRNIAEFPDRVSRELAHALRAECVAVYRVDGESSRRVGQASLPTAKTGNAAENIPAGDAAMAAMLKAQAPIELDGSGSALGKGMLFPLVVLGRVIGALYCGKRAYDRGYDRGERTILADFSRDLAVAILYVDSASDLRNLPHPSQTTVSMSRG